MKTISLRELRHNAGKWIRSVKHEEEIVVTDRGVAVATLRPYKAEPKMKIDWRHRDFVPGYLELLKAGKLNSDIDSSIGISEDRSSRDASVAGITE